MSARNSVYGQKTDCPKNELVYECGECSHVEYVTSQLPSASGNPVYLYSLIYGLLTVQEQFLLHLCNYEPELCDRGDLLGFPCQQCKPYQQSILCHCEDIECDGSTYQEICPDLVWSYSIDFTESPELLAIYEKIIDALTEFQGVANWLGIDEFSKLIFGDDAKVFTYQNSTYFIDIGRTMTDAEMLAANYIPFPVPAGNHIKIMEAT